MPADLKDRVEASAKENLRSLNAEIIARLEESFSNEPIRPLLTEHEAAIHTLTSLYQETLERIKEWKRITNISEMEKIELMHEEATAHYLRHAIARAALPSEERAKVRKQTRPLGIDEDAYLVTKAVENTSARTNE